MSNLNFSMPIVTTLVTMNRDEGEGVRGGGNWTSWSRMMNRSARAHGHEGGVDGGLAGDVDGKGDSLLSMVMVRYLHSFEQLHRVAAFYILQVTRRFSGGVLTTNTLLEVVFSTLAMGFGMFYYQWKFFGENRVF